MKQKKEVHEFVKKYGLLGLIYSSVYNRDIVGEERVLMIEKNYITKENILSTDEYVNMFIPFAGKLIEDAGLKGYTVGGACVSEKHAGFVINKANGTAKDVLDVIHHVQEEVKRQFGVELHPEVRILGED